MMAYNPRGFLLQTKCKFVKLGSRTVLEAKGTSNSC